MNTEQDLKVIAEQEARLRFERFDAAVAWELGVRLKEAAEGLHSAIAMDISLFGQALFFYAMPGATPDNADWIRRKRNVVQRFHRSSYAVGLMLKQKESSLEARGLHPQDYAAHGGVSPFSCGGGVHWGHHGLGAAPARRPRAGGGGTGGLPGPALRGAGPGPLNSARYPGVWIAEPEMDFDQDTEALEPSANQTRFGRAMRAHWFLDPSIIYLNHGTVGATPKQVLAVQQALREEMEQQPARFLLRELSALSGPSERALPRLREAAQAVARFMGAEGQDLVFVDNATTGVNAVLGSLELQPGDEILITNLAYGAVRNAAALWPSAGGRLATLELPFPVSSPADYVNRLAQALTPAPAWRSSTTSPPRPRWCCPWPRWRPAAGRRGCRCWWMGPTPRGPSPWTFPAWGWTTTPATCTSGPWPPKAAVFCGRPPSGNKACTRR